MRVVQCKFKNLRNIITQASHLQLSLSELPRARQDACLTCNQMRLLSIFNMWIIDRYELSIQPDGPAN